MLPVLLLASTIVAVVVANDAVRVGVGRVFTELELLRLGFLVVVMSVLGGFVVFLRRDPDRAQGRLRARAAAAAAAVRARVDALPTWFVLGEIIVLSAAVRIALDRGATVPVVFGDELIYSSLAKSFAATGELAVRGVATLQWSVLYPVVISPAYLFAGDGVTAYAAVKVINALVAASAAVPAYLLARMVVSRGWALLVAALAIAGPAGAYSALVMTESLFYPLFLLFVYALARALTRPSVVWQLATLGLLAACFLVRQQAGVLAPAVVTAVLGVSVTQRSVRATLREYAVTLGALGGLLVCVGVVSLLSDGRSLLGAYGVLVRTYALDDVATWAIRHIAVLELSVGVVAALAVPLALRNLLQAPLDRRQVGFACAVGSNLVWMLISVAALSASPWGLDRLHERSLYYVVPLILASFVYWLAAGMPRPLRLTALVAALGIAPPLFLAGEHVHLTTLDAVTLIPWAETWAVLELESIPLVYVLATVVGAGSMILLHARTAVVPIVSVLVAFVVVTSAVHRATGPGRATAGLGWIDARLGADATAVFVNVPAPERTCVDVARSEATRMLAVYTEFFNKSVTRVAYVRERLRLDGLGFATRLEVRPDGVLTDRGRPFSARHVVLDSRVQIAGRRLDRLEASGVLSRPGSLTLWETPGRIRLEQPRGRGERPPSC